MTREIGKEREEGRFWFSRRPAGKGGALTSGDSEAGNESSKYIYIYIFLSPSEQWW